MAAFEIQAQECGSDGWGSQMVKAAENGKLLWQHGWTAMEEDNFREVLKVPVAPTQHEMAQGYGALQGEMEKMEKLLLSVWSLARPERQGLRIYGSSAQVVPCYWCFIDSYCIKYLTHTIRRWAYCYVYVQMGPCLKNVSQPSPLQSRCSLSHASKGFQQVQKVLYVNIHKSIQCSEINTGRQRWCPEGHREGQELRDYFPLSLKKMDTSVVGRLYLRHKQTNS